MPPVIPASPDFSGKPTDVLPDQGNTPVNPLNDGIPASLPPEIDSNTPDGILPKTFKLPASTVASIERVIQQLNDGLRPGQAPYTVHSYGIEVLNNHEAYRRLANQYNDLAARYNQVSAALTAANQELGVEQQRNQDLGGQLKQLLDYSNRLEHQPTPVTPQPPAPQISSNEQVWQEKYETARQEIDRLLTATDQDKAQSQALTSFVRSLPGLVGILAREAARTSWYTQEYYQWYFQQLVTNHLSAE
ncbi:hypothetical protein GCM10027578_21990 [Spirosoma luteolum]